MPNCQCSTCRAVRWIQEWREQHSNTFTQDAPAGVHTPFPLGTIAGYSTALPGHSTATGVVGVGKLSGSREDRMKLVTNISHLNDWEIQPLLFLSERLLSGQREYGPERKYRDWQADIAEEAADIIAYYAWLRYERENP